MSGLSFNVDFRNLLPPVRDQGQRGTCLAFAITSCHETARYRKQASSEALGEELLFWGALQHMPSASNSDGVSISASDKALNMWGQSEDQHWPYDGNRDHKAADYVPPATAVDPVNCLKARLTSSPADTTSLLSCLDLGMSVVLVVRLAEQFHYTLDGWINIPASPSDIIKDTAHAVLVVGYCQDTSRPGGGFFVFRNSWGEEWGDNGYGYMPFEYIEKHGLQVCVLSPL